MKFKVWSVVGTIVVVGVALTFLVPDRPAPDSDDLVPPPITSVVDQNSSTDRLTELEREAEVMEEDLIQRNREIMALAYLTEELETAKESAKKILLLKPNDEHALQIIQRIEAKQVEP